MIREILHHLFIPMNMPASLCMLAALVYWGAVTAGIIEFEWREKPELKGMWRQFISRSVPFPVYFSAMSILFWAGCIAADLVLPYMGGYKAMLFALPVLGVASFLAVRVCHRYRPLFLQWYQKYIPADLTGKECVMETGAMPGQTGHAEIKSTTGSTLINVLNTTGAPLRRGQRVVISGKDMERRGSYLLTSASS